MKDKDKRADRRVPVALRVKLRYRQLDTFIAKFATNVSRGGVFISSRNPKPVGTELRFEIKLADDSTVISGRGRVAWVRPFDPDAPKSPHGMGVEFTQVSKDSRKLLDRIVEHRRSQGIDDPTAIPFEDRTAEPKPPPDAPANGTGSAPDHRTEALDELLQLTDDALAKAIARAKEIAAESEDTDLEALLRVSSAPVAETVDQASNELANLLGGQAVQARPVGVKLRSDRRPATDPGGSAAEEDEAQEPSAVAEPQEAEPVEPEPEPLPEIEALSEPKPQEAPAPQETTEPEEAPEPEPAQPLAEDSEEPAAAEPETNSAAPSAEIEVDSAQVIDETDDEIESADSEESTILMSVADLAAEKLAPDADQPRTDGPFAGHSERDTEAAIDNALGDLDDAFDSSDTELPNLDETQERELFDISTDVVNAVDETQDTPHPDAMPATEEMTAVDDEIEIDLDDLDFIELEPDSGDSMGRTATGTDLPAGLDVDAMNADDLAAGAAALQGNGEPMDLAEFADVPDGSDDEDSDDSEQQPHKKGLMGRIFRKS